MAQESQSYDDWIEEIKPKLQIGLEQLDRGEKVNGHIAIAQLREKLNRIIGISKYSISKEAIDRRHCKRMY